MNGNIFWVGAVTWGNGMGGTTGVVSAANSLVGSTANDQVGSKNWNYDGGVIALTNGNYLVLNSVWDNGSVVDAGAVTWGNGTGGTVGVVSASNSLVGSIANDNVGDDFWGRVIELTNGNYVVVSPRWDLDGTHPDVGAVTWGSGTTGVTGPISTSNSLVGTSANAPVGNIYMDNHGVTALTNGNYVVSSPYWSQMEQLRIGVQLPGAVAQQVYQGSISASNSLVGSHFGDYVGSETIALTNGNYVVNSPDWTLDETHTFVGAVTWGNGTSGTTGAVSASNSLMGLSNASAGGGGVIALANGNYAVSSPTWYDESLETINIGAVTWGDGTNGTIGPISTTNSLVGVNTYDSVGNGGLVALTNGNYVVTSRNIENGTVTWVNGSHVTTGVVSASNSLVGSTIDDAVGGSLIAGGVTALTNGNYVVISPDWDNGSVINAGAITWGDGANGTIGVVSASNSLVGSTTDDQVGSTGSDGGLTILTNGNYVVSIPQWDSGTTTDVGAVTWGDGTGGTVGTISAANSLVGSSMGDEVGNGSFWGDVGVTELPNGNYIVNSPHWNGIAAAGAVTWGNGSSGTAGVISASNSLVNTCANDLTFCESEITALPDGNVSMYFPNWSNGSNHGAVSLIIGLPNFTVGPVGAANSVLGNNISGGSTMVSDYDVFRTQLIVGRPWDNKVTILSLKSPLPTPWIGGISVTSDKNIVTVGRPHIGAEIASYDGFSSGALTAYVPMLFKNAFGGGGYNSALYIQNVDAANTAAISIKYYDSTGALTCTAPDTIAPLASKGYWLPGLSAACLPDGWIGGAVITSDQNIVANGRPHINGEVMTYDSFSSGSLTSYLPMLFKNAFGGGAYDSAFYVQNVDPGNTANLSIKYYDSAGALTCTVSGETVAPLASKGYWLPGLAASCLPDGWVGGVVVTSDQPIVTVGRPHVGSQITTYNGFSAGGTSSYVPMLFKNAFGSGSYDAALYIQNVDPTNTANLTIKYYDLAGTLTCTVSGETVAPLASKGYWLPGLSAPACRMAGWEVRWSPQLNHLYRWVVRTLGHRSPPMMVSPRAV